jgi:hypothetical protein
MSSRSPSAPASRARCSRCWPQRGHRGLLRDPDRRPWGEAPPAIANKMVPGLRLAAAEGVPGQQQRRGDRHPRPGLRAAARERGGRCSPLRAPHRRRRASRGAVAVARTAAPGPGQRSCRALGHPARVACEARVRRRRPAPQSCGAERVPAGAGVRAGVLTGSAPGVRGGSVASASSSKRSCCTNGSSGSRLSSSARLAQ